MKIRTEIATELRDAILFPLNRDWLGVIEIEKAFALRNEWENNLVWLNKKQKELSPFVSKIVKTKKQEEFQEVYYDVVNEITEIEEALKIIREVI